MSKHNIIEHLKSFTLKTLLVFLGVTCSTLSFTQNVLDADGNSYSEVIIGNQAWLNKNLETTSFNNGDPIPTISGPVNNDSNSIFQWAYNNNSNLVSSFGRLYTFYAANDERGVCPFGWRVPTVEDFEMMITAQGGELIAGNHLKDTGTAYWDSTGSTVDNSSGFSARGSGLRGNPELFGRLGKSTSFWTSTTIGNGSFPRAYAFHLFDSVPVVQYGAPVGNVGASIRCIKSNVSSSHDNILPTPHFKIYPNPSNGSFEISRNTSQRELKIAIYTIDGQMIEELYWPIHQQKVKLDKTHLIKGIYLIRVFNNTFESNLKLVIN